MTPQLPLVPYRAAKFSDDSHYGSWVWLLLDRRYAVASIDSFEATRELPQDGDLGCRLEPHVVISMRYYDADGSTGTEYRWRDEDGCIWTARPTVYDSLCLTSRVVEGDEEARSQADEEAAFVPWLGEDEADFALAPTIEWPPELPRERPSPDLQQALAFDGWAFFGQAYQPEVTWIPA